LAVYVFFLPAVDLRALGILGARTTEPKCRLPQIEAGQYPGIERGLDDARQPPGGNAKICALLVPREGGAERLASLAQLVRSSLFATNLCW